MNQEDCGSEWPTSSSGGPQSTPLVRAIESGEPDLVSRVLAELTPAERKQELAAECAGSGSGGRRRDGSSSSSASSVMLPVFHAAATGNVGVFLKILGALKANLSENAVGEMLTSARNPQGRSLLMTALKSSSAPVVRALLDQHAFSPAQRVQMLSAVNARDQTPLMIAVQTGEEEMVWAMAECIGDEEAGVVTATDRRGWSALSFAVASGRSAIVDAVVSVVERVLPPGEVNPALDYHLPLAVSEVLVSKDTAQEEKAVEVLSCLIRHGAGPSAKQVSQISSKAGFASARKCFLDAICAAVNPLLVGMRLSLLLENAGGIGTEGQRQVAARLQNEVEDLVLEVFERLPQTVDGFRKGDIAGSGMEACSIVFTPEKMRQADHSNPTHLYHEDDEGSRVEMGPLELALQARHQLELFCTQPLVLDFLSRSFTRGLPGLYASESGTGEADEVRISRQRTVSVQAASSGGSDLEGVESLSQELLDVLGGPHETFGSLTIFPGAQFILAQLVARPVFCYSVPAVRMGVDLLVYVLMICLFANSVLSYDGAVGVGEWVFFCYVLGAILVEINELWEGREEYMKDHWNALDVTALAFCGAAFLIRLYDPENLWGRALYGAGAPLLLFRTLFFAQFMPAQGPMIEIIFSLAGELLRFCTILLVTMMGFAMSFFALFRHSCTVDAFRSYWATWIALLRAMLGETKLYDDFTVDVECCEDVGQEPSDEFHCEDFFMECCHNVESEHFNGLVGKALLASYNVVMGIILLNLLIAVLSEAYVDVKENIDTESKVSRTLVIRHYVNAVEEDMLPSPLNLVQYTVSVLAMGVGIATRRKGLFRRAKFFAGLTLFWFVSGLFTVCTASLLWFFSWPKGIFMFFQRRSTRPVSGASVATQAAVLLCGVAMPLFLVYKWLWSSTCGALWSHLAVAWRASGGGAGSAEYSEIQGGGACGESRRRPDDDGIVGEALKRYGNAGAGVSLNVQQLREFLANPMKDPVVQRDEETRETTVEHVKLLRDNLTEMVGARVGELDASAAARFESLETSLDGRVDMLSQKVERIDEKLAEILRKLN
eukprot:g9689.t1